MAGFAVRGFNHTSFTVASLDRAIRFFRDLLGFELVSRARRSQALIERMTSIPGADVEIAFVRGPDHTIELVEYKPPTTAGRPRRVCAMPDLRTSRSTSTTLPRRWPRRGTTGSSRSAKSS